MATFYLDFENGNDANDGTTFANRWKTITSGATAARTAPGDTIRIMGSPDPTSCGINATWTGQKSQGTKSISSSTNASPISMSVTAHGYSTGDTVQVVNHATNTNANGVWEITFVDANTFTLNGSTGNGVGGASGTVRLRNGSVVRLASALTQNIASCGNRGGGRTPTWTQSTNVTTTQSTATLKEGDVSDSIAVAAAFTTGLAAFVATGTLNLSGYQGVSFWIQQTAGTLAVAGDVELALCTDTAGVTAVHHVTIPALSALGNWTPVYWDNGSALNSAIKSIAFKVLVDRGAVTFLVSNIIAVKASSGGDNLNFGSLVGKNNGVDTWYAIQSINGTRVLLDTSPTINSNLSSFSGYIGTSETVPLYKREAIKLTPVSGSNFVNIIQGGGTAGNVITFDGGYDRTNMSTKTLETWIDGQTGTGIAFSAASLGMGYFTLTGIAGVRFNTVFDGITLGSGVTLNFVALNNNGTGIRAGMFDQNNLVPTGSGITISVGWGNNNSGNAVFLTEGFGGHITSIGQACNNLGDGVFFSNHSGGLLDYAGNLDNNGSGIQIDTSSVNVVVTTLVSASHNSNQGINVGKCTDVLIENAGLLDDNTTAGIFFSDCFNALVCNGTTSNNGVGIKTGSGFPIGRNCALFNFSVTEATEVSFGTYDQTIVSHNHDKTLGNHVRFLDGGLIASATDQTHSASGISWKFNPTATTRSALWPMVLSLGPVVLLANTATTISIWARRDSTNIVGQLLVQGGQAGGVSSDVSVSCTPSINTWTQYSITLTATEQVPVEVLFLVWDGVGTTNSFWVDDLTVN